MAAAKTARLFESEDFDSSTRFLRFELEDSAPLGFVGGQYIIVDSGIVLPSGKVAKRAYSILSSDDEQHQFELAVRRMGPGSSYLHDLQVGATVRFSGPWGKFVPEATPASGTTLVVVTDTGITAALGLLRASSFRERLSRTSVWWLAESETYFLPESFVRARVPDECREMSLSRVPPVGHPERIAVGLGRLEERWPPHAPMQVYLAGDGALLYPLAEALGRRGVTEPHVATECFFNNPARKVGVSATGDARV